MSFIQAVVKGITPPYVAKAARKALGAFAFSEGKESNDALFGGDDRIFKELVTQAKVYFEYGCGSSTIWSSCNSKAKIFAVDTNQQWVQEVRNKQCSNNEPCLLWVNCGKLGDWGTPINYAFRKNFKEYILGPFGMTNERPNLILIDGRFRVACFLMALSKSDPGTSIIFDDYVDRPYYHVVEEFCPQPRFSGRQAVFTVPQTIDSHIIDVEIDKFGYVFG